MMVRPSWMSWVLFGASLWGCGGPAAPPEVTAPEGAAASPSPAAAPGGTAAPPSSVAAGMEPAPPAGEVTIAIGQDGSGSPLPPPAGATFADAGAQDPCAPGAAPPRGDVLRLLWSGGALRWYALHVPPGYAGRPTALVLNFHGFTSDPLQEALLSGMNAAADRRGILVAYPAGIWRSWNAGACCGYSSFWHTDDVGLTRDVIDAVAREYCVDARRVFATGMSNGGFLSHRLACELSDRIAAVAPVAGVLGVLRCAPGRKVPIMGFHGTLDLLVPYGGNLLLGFGGVLDTYAAWSRRDGCGGAEVTLLQRGDSTCVGRSGCGDGSESILCTARGGGHTWPGGFPVPILGHTTRDMNATEMMLDFFERHPMP